MEENAEKLIAAHFPTDCVVIPLMLLGLLLCASSDEDKVWKGNETILFVYQGQQSMHRVRILQVHSD